MVRTEPMTLEPAATVNRKHVESILFVGLAGQGHEAVARRGVSLVEHRVSQLLKWLTVAADIELDFIAVEING